MSFWQELKELLFGHKNPESTAQSFVTKPKENTAVTTSKGAEEAHKVTIKKKNYTKKKIGDKTVFVNKEIEEKKVADPAFQELLKQKVKEVQDKEKKLEAPEIPNAVSEYKKKEKAEKKTKKPKMTVEGNAKLLYTDEEWNKTQKKPKGKK